MRKLIILTLAAIGFAACSQTNEKMSKCENDSWDKVFPKSEDFCAAVDYLMTREDVNPEQVGIVARIYA